MNRQLSKAEEQLMEYVWQGGSLFMKELIDMYPAPKPAVTTVATLLKRMQQKGFVGYTLYGNSRRYHPLVGKSDYFARHLNGMVKDYFNNSPLMFASLFTRSADFSAAELEELKKIVDGEIKKREKC